MTTEKILSMVLYTVITAVVLPLITLAGNKLIAWLGAKTKNEKAAAYIQTATGIVLNAVKAVFQTYVEALKDAGSFDAKAQQEALNRAKAIIMNQTADEVKAYIAEAYGGFEAWVNTQIEASINTLKNAAEVQQDG